MEPVTNPFERRVRTSEIVNILNLSHWMNLLRWDKFRITLFLSVPSYIL